MGFPAKCTVTSDPQIRSLLNDLAEESLALPEAPAANKPKALSSASRDWDIFDVLQSHILPGTHHAPSWRRETHSVANGHFLSLPDQPWSFLGARDS